MPDSKMIVDKDHVFERSRGCYSCKSYENGELARQHWATCRKNDELFIMMKTGSFDLSNGPIKGDPRFQMLEDMDGIVRAGLAGICLQGKVQTDFVHYQHLCEGWTGREGSSVATAGRPIDPLPAELHEIAADRKKKN